MREMNLEDRLNAGSNRQRIKVITQSSSRVVRSEDEMAILMKSARSCFKKALAAGQIEIVSSREWTLR
ncbi:hypothetical protein ACF3MZ_17020 [Paenibacillaceae bacterium WGS1546]|uniref:hypothetical protein n=1 Tax=Cohnella sp. WGS1546 TaxID=3366810 RepID=UPI00372CE8D1